MEGEILGKEDPTLGPASGTEPPPRPVMLTPAHPPRRQKERAAWAAGPLSASPAVASGSCWQVMTSPVLASSSTKRSPAPLILVAPQSLVEPRAFQEQGSEQMGDP